MHLICHAIGITTRASWGGAGGSPDICARNCWVCRGSRKKKDEKKEKVRRRPGSGTEQILHRLNPRMIRETLGKATSMDTYIFILLLLFFSLGASSGDQKLLHHSLLHPFTPNPARGPRKHPRSPWEARTGCQGCPATCTQRSQAPHTHETPPQLPAGAGARSSQLAGEQSSERSRQRNH